MSRFLIALPLLAAVAVAHAAGSGVPVSPARTTVVAGEPQVFSARFYDDQSRPLAGATVSFSNDACGTFPNGAFLDRATTDSTGSASILFSPLNAGFIRCTVIAGASNGAVVRFDVTTFRLDANVSISASLDPAEPRPGQPFRVTATARYGSFALYNVDIAAKIVARSASASLTASTFNSAQNGYAQITVTPDGRIGDYDIEVSYRGKVKSVPVNAPANPLQDLWWSGLAENGWGMSIVQHRDMLFTILYAYDDSGRPAWYVMPSGEWNAARTAFSGDVFIPTGTPYGNYDATRFDIGAPAGRATIAFAGANEATLDYSIKGATGHKALSRIFFGQGQPSKLPALGDMWWGGTAQNGWGFSVLQQGADLFTLWFTYDDSGAATWMVMPAGTWVDARNWRGTLFRSTGAPWLGHVYDPSAFRMNELGWYNARYNEDGTATFTYSIGGAAPVALPLSRIPF